MFTVDKKLSKILSAGLTKNLPDKLPTASILLGDISISFQDDGQIALFNEAGIFSCECRGHEVNGLPPGAVFKVGLVLNDRKVKIYQEGRVFFSKRGNTFRIFANYFPGSTTAQVFSAHNPQEIGNDTDGAMCHIFHTDDWDIDDYQQEAEKDDSPVPLTPPPSEDD